jgi:hypothetical protein
MTYLKSGAGPASLGFLCPHHVRKTQKWCRVARIGGFGDMMDERALVNAIFETALRGCDADVSARRNALWKAAVCLLADVLRETDPFNRERLLRGIEAELRESVAQLDQLLRQSSGRLQ